MPVLCHCLTCGASFTQYPAIIANGGGKYCSLVCYRAKFPPRIHCLCTICGAAFVRTPTEMSRGGGLYCSKACQAIAMRQERTIVRTCQYCEQSFLASPTEIRHGKAKYCSVQCASSHAQEEPGDRFWRRVTRCLHVHPCDQCCWFWQGALNSKGYGILVIARKKYGAHRFSYALCHHEDITALDIHLIVRHLCHTPACVNPSHLAIGTYKDNMQDSVKDGRMAHGEAHTHAKLTVPSVQEARILRQQGWTWRALAQRYGVTQMAISNACTGKTWKHIA